MLKDELETDYIDPAEPWEGLGGMGMPIVYPNFAVDGSVNVWRLLVHYS